MTIGVDRAWYQSGAFDTTLRWVVLWLCWLVAAQESGERLAQEAREGSMIVYVYSAYALAAIAIIGVARRPWKSLPIHDRQADVIIGGMGIGLALGIQGLLLPRYPDHYRMLHLDAWAIGIFVLSGAVLLFGLRPLARFWQVWLFIIAFAPFPYRLLVLALGGQPLDAGLVMVFMASVAMAIAAGGPKRHAMIAATATAVLGVGLIGVVVVLLPNPPRPMIQSIPALVAAGMVAAVVMRPKGRLRFTDPVPLPTARGVRGPMLTLAVAALAMHAMPLPPPVAQPFGPAPPSIGIGRPLDVPNGWIQTGQEEYSWIQRYLGSDSMLVRQRLVAREPVHAWDVLDRPRIVVVDSMSTHDVGALRSYPEGSVYEMVGARRSPAISFDIGHGVVARMYTVVDERLLLTWSKLTFQWANARTVQRVSIFSVDDHRPEATFPEPQAAKSVFFGNIFTVLLRGNAVTADTTPSYKDRAMLESVARSIVAQQQVR